MTQTVAFVLFDDAEELDFVGPWEVFTMLGAIDEGSVKAVTVSQTGGEIRCAKGMRVMSDHSFDDCPEPDIVVVPGGRGTRNESANPAMLDFVKRMDKKAKVMTSVCTGTFVLAAAGLLDGKRATTHWASVKRLREYERVKVVDVERYVDEGSVVTASGVSAGIDMALYLVGREWGPKKARSVQKAMEYFPEPPYADVPVQE